MTRSEGVYALRQRVWANGYRPVAVQQGEKFPKQMAWTEHARADPPYWAKHYPEAGCLITGILCDGLRAVDIDISFCEGVEAVMGWLQDNVGDGLVRYRWNSPRLLLLYRAEYGEPRKASVTNPDHPLGKQAVEVLGLGQQFVGFGKHPSGADYLWFEDDGPHTVHRDDLVEMREDQVAALLRFAEGVIGKARVRHPTHEPVQAVSRSTWCIPDIVDALAHIPNPMDDYDFWVEIGMACFAATGGSVDGLAAWRAWSGGDQKCDGKWRSFRSSGITAATLRFNARQRNPDWLQPSRQLAIIPNVFQKAEH